MEKNNVVCISGHQKNKLMPKSKVLSDIRKLFKDNCNSICQVLDYQDKHPFSFDELPKEMRNAVFGAGSMLDTYVCEMGELVECYFAANEKLSINTQESDESFIKIRQIVNKHMIERGVK